MTIFISGSLAYDTILGFDGVFADHLLTGKLREVNVTFQTPRMTRNFGGCAGNIAYALKSLGQDPLVVTAWGCDCASYRDHFNALGIRTDGILTFEDAYTAQALITTDRLGNQITSFHEGAMRFADQALTPEGVTPKIGIITPTDTPVMKAHVLHLQSLGARIVLDVGQASAYLTGEDFRWLIDRVDILTMSSYEWAVLLEKTGYSENEVLERVDALIVTLAHEGSRLYTQNQTQHFPALPIEHFASPVGCGDAFRGGLLCGLALGFSWNTTMRLATLMGAIKAQVDAPQGYRFRASEIAELYEKFYAEKIVL